MQRTGKTPPLIQTLGGFMEYRIFGGNTLAQLELRVNEYIKVGFEPCGGIFSFFDSRSVYQPMLKRHPNHALDSDGKKPPQVS